MADQLYSAHWYRIADVKLSLRSHVRVHQHRYRNSTWFVLRDDATGKHHRFNESAYNFISLIDGKRSVDYIWNLLQDKLGDNAPTQDEVIRLLGTLHYANHLLANIAPDIQELLERRKKERKQLLKTRYGNPLSLRFPLIDPDLFLRKYLHVVSPLFTRTAAVIAVVIIMFAALLAIRNWDLLSSHALENTLSPYNLFLMWLLYPLIKAVHELGHGFAVRRWGGEVHELGIMFLVLMPVPYVDASSASSFRSKYKRMFVGAAGIIVELLLASIALMIWLNIQQGLMSDILFNIMLIGGVSTLFFNGNPLLKFDGYFVLADATEIPGLGQRSNNYYGYLIQKYIFRVKNIDTPVQAKGEATWFLVYAASSFIYRLFLMVAITLFVANQYFFIGVALALWVIYIQAIMPVLRWLRYLLTSPVLMQCRERAISITSFVVFILLIITFVIPVPLNTITQGVVWLPEKAYVRASADGFVEDVLVKQGEVVEIGEPLIITSDPLLPARLKLFKSQFRELEVKHISLASKDIVKADIALEEMRLIQGKIAHLESQINDLVMRSKSNGKFVTSNSKKLEGHFVKKGDPVAYVIEFNDVSIRVVVPQNAIGLVRKKVDYIEVRFVNNMNKKYRTQVSREIPAATYRLPSKALSQQGGGNIATDPFDADGIQTRDQYFQFEIALPEKFSTELSGQRVYVKFVHGYEAMAMQWYRAIGELFLNELGRI